MTRRRTRRGSPGEYRFWKSVVWATVVVMIAALTPPAHAAHTTGTSVGSSLPAYDDDALTEQAERCRHAPDAFYVPRDPQGKWFWWFCRDASGVLGDGFSALSPWEGGKRVNKDQPDNWNAWMSRYATVGNLVNFRKLDAEPCDTWKHAELDLEQAQCAKLRDLVGRASPCDQWWGLINSVQGQPGVAHVLANPALDRQLVAECKTKLGHFEKSWAPLRIVDVNEYDRYDFSAPSQITKPIGEIIAVGQWVALAAGVFGLLITAAKLAISYRDGEREAASGVITVMAAVSMAATALAIATLLLSG